MANGDEEKKGRKKAKQNIKKFGKLSSERGVLPSNVSGRDIGLGTAIMTGPKNWPGLYAHSASKRTKSDSFKKGYNKQLKSGRKSSKKKLKKTAKQLKKQNINRARSMSEGNGLKYQQNKKVKKSKMKNAANPDKGGGGFMRKAQMSFDGKQLLKDN